MENSGSVLALEQVLVKFYKKKYLVIRPGKKLLTYGGSFLERVSRLRDWMFAGVWSEDEVEGATFMLAAVEAIEELESWDVVLIIGGIWWLLLKGYLQGDFGMCSFW